jgi:dTMP kinase
MPHQEKGSGLRGRFITFEGIDGSGKSTHIEAVAALMRAEGRVVQLTREPGGTPLAERLREVLLHAPMDPLTEALLVFAARRDHVQQVIEPALARGEVVLCDRFTDATFAYQGSGRGFDAAVLQTLEGWVHADLQPDLTLWFDLNAEQAAHRVAAARAPDRFEQQGTAFFQRVIDGYAARAAAFPNRFVRIDASASRADVADSVRAALQPPQR